MDSATLSIGSGDSLDVILTDKTILIKALIMKVV